MCELLHNMVMTEGGTTLDNAIKGQGHIGLQKLINTIFSLLNSVFLQLLMGIPSSVLKETNMREDVNVYFQNCETNSPY